MDEVERFVTGTVSPRRSPYAPKVMITTLGRFAVVRDGEEVPVSEWGSRMARQICKRLVAARGWPVTREQLIDMTWPEETDMRRLSARLSVQLSAIRRVLGGGVIADRSSVRLDLDEVSTDLEDFFAADSAEDVVAFYSGEFLPDDVYEDWTAPVRDEARARFITAGHRLGTDLSDDDRKVWLARRLVEADPYDERAHRLLVAALLSIGEKNEAEHAHERWVSVFSELGIEVEPLESLLPV